MHKNGKWAERVLAQQREDGSFGHFHTLSQDSGSPVTTEQALRRLFALGFTAEDEPMRRALRYMEECLAGDRTIPDRREKGHAWDFFVSMMLSTWIRRLTTENEQANRMASDWGAVIERAFASGAYNGADYADAVRNVFGDVLYGPRLLDFATFYQVSLLIDQTSANTERLLLNYLIRHESGVYYLSSRPATVAPPFRSRQASGYVGLLELLAQYRHAPAQMGFAVDWLADNRSPDGRWDMGAIAKDGVYLPLSDNWRSAETRIADCTERIERLLARLHGAARVQG